MKLKKPGCLWIALLLTLVSGCGRSKPDNVILIVVDTLRADHLSVYGYERQTSPQLEQWATSGMVFESALAASSWTLPTFGSVLTGLWPAQHSAGARLQQKTRNWQRAPLSAEVTTITEVLQANGFSTGAIVNNAFLREHFGAARGFDFYDYKKGRRAGIVIDLAQTWLSETGEDPFFLMIHLIDPHLPYVPPADFLGKFGEVSAADLPARGRKNIVERLPELTDADKRALVARYDEEIAFVDQELGRLLEFVSEEGLLENTLVILTSDHGEEMFDHGGFEHGHSMFQEVLHVPMIFWGPGVLAGRRSAPVSVVDLAPTILDATGVASEMESSGISLWGSIQDGQRPMHREILAQNTLWGRERKAIISWPFKLIVDSKTGSRQLYDLSVDSLEKRDLSVENPGIAQELERRLHDRLAGLAASPAEPGANLTEEVEEELRALGYLD